MSVEIVTGPTPTELRISIFLALAVSLAIILACHRELAVRLRYQE